MASPWPLLAIIALALLELAAATPSIAFPINSQVPPVARIDEPFSFVFSASTFASSSELTYTLTDSPDWVSIDSKARRIYGTPTDQDVAEGDVVGVVMGLVATDDSGSVTLDATLVVSRSPAPKLNIPISSQIPDFAPFSQPSSIIMRPATSFALTLASNSFADPLGRDLTYYAVMADNSPLPSWITFNRGKLSFSGATPPLAALVQTPQSFDFQLVASDVPGFSGASLPFSIVVGNHAVTAEQSYVTLNATVGERMSYTGLAGDVQADDKDAKSGGVSIIATSSLPTWLSLDKNTWEISGTPTATAVSANFTITMQDQYSDTLNLTVLVNVMDGLFKGNLPGLNVTAGEHFTFNLSNYLASTSDLDVSVATNPTASWVNFDSQKNVISGDVPSTLGGSHVAISIHAKSKDTGVEGTKQLNVSIMRQISPTTLITAPPRTSSSTTQSSGSTLATAAAAQGSHKSHTREILLAVLIPLCLLILLAIGILAFCLHRRKKRPSSIDRRDISRPVPGSFTMNGGSSGEMAESGRDSCDTDDERRTPASHLAHHRNMSGFPFSDASLLTPPPSRPSSGHAWPSSAAWPASLRSSDTYTASSSRRPPLRNKSSTNLNLGGGGAYSSRHMRRASRPRFSKILNVDIPDSNIFPHGDGADRFSTPDSTYFSNTVFASSPPLGTPQTPPHDTADRGTKLEDFLHAGTIRRVPPDSAEPSPLYPPPLARLRTASPSPSTSTRPPPPPPPPRSSSRPLLPRRLFAAPTALTPPPASAPVTPPARGPPHGPLSSWPWHYDGLGLPHASSDEETASSAGSLPLETPSAPASVSVSPSRWPHPPSSAAAARPPTAGTGTQRFAFMDEEDEEDGSARQRPESEDVDEWIGVATSRYSKASSWLEAVGGGGSRPSQDGASARSRESARSRGDNKSSGEYAVYI